MIRTSRARGFGGRARTSAAAFVSLLLAVVGVSCGGTQRSGDSGGGDSDIVAGGALYRTYCGLCHGDEGEGYAADNANALANPDFLAVATTEFLTKNIAEGHPGTPMAPYGTERGGPLSPAEVQQLVAFIESWREGEPANVHNQIVEGNAARGRITYSQRCATCHGAQGEGGNAMSLRHPIFLGSASDGYLRYAIEHGRRGTAMPAFGGDLPDSTIDDLVALMRTFEHGADAAPRQGGQATVHVDQVIIHPDAQPARFRARDDLYVPAEQVAEALEEGKRMIILDARATSDWLAFHIPGAVPSPYYELETLVDRIPNDGTPIIAYCACPHAASGRVAAALRERGYENVYVLDEGVLVWRSEGYPIESAPEPPEE